MYLTFQKRLELVDKWILIPFLILIIFSMLAVYSASSYIAAGQYDDSSHFLTRQVIYVVISLIAFSVAFMMPFKIFRSKAVVFLSVLVTLGLLLYLVFFGEDVLGASRWISLPFLNIQPAEFAKLTIIIYLAYILEKRQESLGNDDFKSLKDVLLKPTLLVGLMTALILIQPDTGTTFIIFFIVLTMISASGVSLKYGFGFFGVTISGIIFVFTFVRLFGQYIPFLGYRYDRFLGLWNPFKYSDTFGHQLVNSYYALARGGFFGVGLGNSVQKTGYLPFPHTDFIMSIIGEEIGLLGITIILLLFFAMVSRIYLTAIRHQKSYDSLICVGLATMLMIQAFVNLAGVVGLLPITGVTFPLLSYGGSSLLVVSISLGIAANASVRQRVLKLKEEYRQGHMN